VVWATIGLVGRWCRCWCCFWFIINSSCSVIQINLIIYFV